MQPTMMPSVPQKYITWTTALVDKLMTCILTTGAHLNNRKWKDCADSFFASPQYLNEIYVTDVEKGLRRIKEKYTAEYTRVCGTMGWRDYAIGNLSAMETGELGPVEIKMKQIIEEQDTEKAKKNEEKALQVRLTSLENCIISGTVTPTMKPAKKSKVVTSSGKEAQIAVSIDEVRCGICIENYINYFTYFICNRVKQF
jgi:hypothetical protein